MSLTLLWVLLMILGSGLFTWAGIVLINLIQGIQLGNSDSLKTNDPSILGWLINSWHQIRQRNWQYLSHAREDFTPFESIEGLPEANPDQEGRLASGQIPPNPEGKTEPNTKTANLFLNLVVPEGVRIQLTIETLPASLGEPEIQIRQDELAGVPPVVVQRLSGDDIERLTSPGCARDVRKSRLRQVRGSAFGRWLSSVSMPSVLFGLAVLVYLATRLVGLERFPIYFFTDEAVHTILAEDLVANHFRFNGVLLPTYFPLGASFGLNSLSVYLQVIPLLLFGKSVFVTRAVSVSVTLLGGVAVSLILKDFFKSRYWWSGILILSTTPTWFFHSRTAFENVELASFYALFLYFYLSYRLRSSKWVFLAIFSGALVFYSHGLGQFLMAITAVVLFLVDLPYHWSQRKMLAWGGLFAVLLALPYLRFSIASGGIFEEQMRMRGSYWLSNDLSLAQKLLQFAREYLSGLNPGYWFAADTPRDLIRHQMKGYGHLSIVTLPFLVSGLWLAIRNFRSPAYRTVLIAILASPFGAALAQVAILRVIWLVLPTAIVTTLGVNQFLCWLEKKRLSQSVLAISLFIILAGFNAFMWNDALKNGPSWYRDYSLYGLQYGARQVFGDAIPRILEANPAAQVVVTPTWANGTDNFVRFFLTPEQQSRTRLDSIEAYLYERLPVDENLYVILTKLEYESAIASPKFAKVNPVATLPYPDGTIGFYIVNLEYSVQADDIFAAEKLARSQPVESQVMVDGQLVRISYSQIDMGQPEAIFDGDTYTLMRGLEANPFMIDLEFPTGRTISLLSADFANMDFSLKAELFAQDGNSVVYEETYRGLQGDPHVDLVLDRGPQLVTRLRLEVLSLNGGQQPHIHIREIKLIP